MGIITNKLRSNQGLTLILSLLLFLICTVAGSVVLTAGTASAGTISERAKMDQRYYSVTSAVELLRKELDGVTVTATADYQTSNLSINPPKIRENEIGGIARDIIGTQSEYFLGNIIGECKGQTAYPEFTLKCTDDSTNTDIPELCAIIKISPVNYNLRFTIQSDTASSDKKYGLQMDYVASYSSDMLSADCEEFNIRWYFGPASLVE